MFNVQELATAVQHNIAVAIVVFDDGAFGNVRRIQQKSFGGRTIASELQNPGFAELAEVFGMPGVRAEGADALTGALREALTHDGPVMIEVPVGPMPNFQRQLREEIAERLAQHLGEAAPAERPPGGPPGRKDPRHHAYRLQHLEHEGHALPRLPARACRRSATPPSPLTSVRAGDGGRGLSRRAGRGARVPTTWPLTADDRRRIKAECAGSGGSRSTP